MDVGVIDAEAVRCVWKNARMPLFCGRHRHRLFVRPGRSASVSSNVSRAALSRQRNSRPTKSRRREKGEGEVREGKDVSEWETDLEYIAACRSDNE